MNTIFSQSRPYIAVLAAVFGLQCASSAAWAQDLIIPPGMTAPTAVNNANDATNVTNTTNPTGITHNDVILLKSPTDANAPKVVSARAQQAAQKKNKTTAKNSQPAESTENTEVSVLGGLYVYVDEMGVPHYALQQLDERYQLFANAGPIMDKDIKLAVGMPDKNLAALVKSNNVSSFGVASATVQRRLLNSVALARYEPTIRKHANTHGVDINLVKAVMAAESGFNSGAISPKNAMGLMQVIPPTAARYGITAEQLMIPERNIYAGVRYLRDLSRMFKGRPDLIAAAYNAGEGAVYKYNRKIPPYAETQNYVRTVMQYYQVYNGGRGMSSMDNMSGVDVRIRGKSSAKRNVVMTSGKAGNNARRSMQQVKASQLIEPTAVIITN